MKDSIIGAISASTICQDTRNLDSDAAVFQKINAYVCSVLRFVKKGPYSSEKDRRSVKDTAAVFWAVGDY